LSFFDRDGLRLFIDVLDWKAERLPIEVVDDFIFGRLVRDFFKGVVLASGKIIPPARLIPKSEHHADGDPTTEQQSCQKRRPTPRPTVHVRRIVVDRHRGLPQDLMH
jgi:hypothetical protein